MKIHPVGAELFHADGWTDTHDEANSGFSEFCARASETLNNQIKNNTAAVGTSQDKVLTQKP